MSAISGVTAATPVGRLGALVRALPAAADPALHSLLGAVALRARIELALRARIELALRARIELARRDASGSRAGTRQAVQSCATDAAPMGSLPD